MNVLKNILGKKKSFLSKDLTGKNSTDEELFEHLIKEGLIKRKQLKLTDKESPGYVLSDGQEKIPKRKK